MRTLTQKQITALVQEVWPAIDNSNKRLELAYQTDLNKRENNVLPGLVAKRMNTKDAKVILKALECPMVSSLYLSGKFFLGYDIYYNNSAISSVEMFIQKIKDIEFSYYKKQYSITTTSKYDVERYIIIQSIQEKKLDEFIEKIISYFTAVATL